MIVTSMLTTAINMVQLHALQDSTAIKEYTRKNCDVARLTRQYSLGQFQANLIFSWL